jgi:hypothetical protein
MVDQIRCQRRKSIVLTFCPTIFDPKTGARTNAGLNQTLLEGSRQRQWRWQPFV